MAGDVRSRGLAMCAALFLAAGFLLLAAAPAAAAPPQLWTKCDSGEPADQRCDLPRGIAADPRTGHVFVADQGHQRIVELDPLGLFVRAWGWDVVQSGPGNQSTAPEPPEFEICVPDAGDTCKAGVSGGGAGQFSNPLGVALDSAGSVYAVDFSNRRVQKFDAKGNFLLTFGGEVNKTKVEEGTASEAEENLCPFDPGDECQKGTQGTGNGQFGQWRVGSFIGVDTKGTEADGDDEVYVGDQGRIQIFDSDGNYLEDWPDSEGALAGETVTSLAVGPAGNLYVTYFLKPDVRKLTPAGEQLEAPRFAPPPPDEFTDRSVTAVAVRDDGHVLAFAEPATGSGFVQIDRIFEFDPAGNVVDQFGKEEFGSSHGLATNLCAGSEAPGNLYATNRGGPGPFVRAYGTEPVGCFKARTLPATEVTETSATLNGTVNPDGALSEDCRFEWGTSTEYGNIADCAESEAAIGAGTEPVPVHADLEGLQAATVHHFRLRAKIGGETQTGPDESFKTKGPPVISGEHVVAATDSEAIVAARVNPEGLPTSCRVEFGTGGAFDRSSAGTGIIGEDRSEHAVAVTLGGLEPATTYEWRFACENTALHESGEATGAERTLTTYRAFAADTDCPNQVLRGGAAASLPDCRAYEMVSPVDKNGADIVATLSGAGDPGRYVQASPDRAKITYTTKGPPAFGEDPPGSFKFNQYIATREASDPRVAGDGWSSEAIHAPYLGKRVPGAVPGNFREFISFSPDLCSAWLVDLQTPPLNPDGQEDRANLYRRQSCEPGRGSFETISDDPVAAEAKPNYVDNKAVQGTSADARHAVFLAEAPLTEDAAEGFSPQIYDRFGGANHLVSVLPDGSGGDPEPGDGMGFASPGDNAVGSGWNFNLEGAVSEDGSRVYWTAGASTGRIYLRQGPERGIVAGECEAPGAPCTVPVSEELSGLPFDDAFFWQAAPDGSRALYSEGGDLYLFDLASSESELVAEEVIGVAGASEDLSRVYLVSRAVLEEGAEAGEPNLYLAEGGSFAFIATLTEGDVGEAEPGTTFAPYDIAAKGTYARATRVTPDGSQIAFQSRAQLSEFDNTAANGRPTVQVFTYRAGGEGPLCVSCNPSGARPAAREMTPPYTSRGWPTPSDVFAAAWIATWEHPTYASKAISEDGNRIFFNSNDALVPRDGNGAQDVYEWEAPGTGSCEVGDPSHFPRNGGCLYLISSGESSFESEFWEASAAGDDVFFTTESSLLPQDPGSVDLYDARVGGGFPQPVEPAECEGEACQSPPPPPEFPAPASGAFRGPGNVVPARNCHRAAKRARRLSRKAKGARRAGRRAARNNNRANARRMQRKARRFARRAAKLSRNAKRCRRAGSGRAAR